MLFGSFLILFIYFVTLPHISDALGGSPFDQVPPHVQSSITICVTVTILPLIERETGTSRG